MSAGRSTSACWISSPEPCDLRRAERPGEEPRTGIVESGHLAEVQARLGHLRPRGAGLDLPTLSGRQLAGQQT
ncbi:MAG: hypothetical protein IPJ62_14740 [Betaproteobacteria bacterium]|nr:hypothetical protein [Betaproteobacteria bacterium]